MFRQPSSIEKIGAKVIKVDSFEVGYEGSKAIDGNPKTMWHTSWTSSVTGHPHEIQLEFGKSVALKGLTYQPRQDSPSNGEVKDYSVYVSETKDEWGRAIA